MSVTVPSLAVGVTTPFESLFHGNAALTDPDVAQSRAAVTVAEALEAAEKEAVRESVDRAFPAVAALLADEPADHARDASLPDAGNEHTDPDFGLDLDEIAAVLPDVVKQAMQKALPERYTPAFAAQFADAMIAALREPEPTAQAPGINAFTDMSTGRRVTFTCLPGCDMDHSADSAVPQHPDDIYCNVPGDDGSLSLVGQLCEGHGPEEFRVLSWHIDVHPFSSHVAQRRPVANIEVIEDHYIEDLGPDALAEVIGVLQDRVDSLRTAHTRLVELRAAYRAQTGVIA